MRFYVALFLLLTTSLVEDVAASRGGFRLPTSTDCKKGGFFPTPGECNKYYICIDVFGNEAFFTILNLNCTEPGTVFDDKLFRCNDVSAAGRPECEEIVTSTQGKEQLDTQAPIVTDSSVVTDPPVTTDLTSADVMDLPVMLPETVDQLTNSTPECTFDNNYKTADLLYPNYMYSYCSINNVVIYDFCSKGKFVEEKQMCELEKQMPLDTVDLLTNSTPVCTFDNKNKTVHHLYPNMYSYCSIDNIVEWLICPEGLVFVEEKQKCDVGEKHTLPETADPLTDSTPVCTFDDEYKTAHHLHPNLYSYCSINNIIEWLICPKGLVFVEEKQKCDLGEKLTRPGNDKKTQTKALEKAQKVAEEAKKALEDNLRNAQEIAEKVAEESKKILEEVPRRGQEIAEAAQRHAQEAAEAALRQTQEITKTVAEESQKRFEEAQRIAQEAAEESKKILVNSPRRAQVIAEAAQRHAQEAAEAALRQTKEITKKVAEESKKRFEEARRIAKDIALRQTQEVAQKVAEESKKRFEEARRIAQKAAEDAKKTLEETQRKAQEIALKVAEESKKRLEEAQKRAQQVAEAARRHAQKVAETVQRQAQVAAEAARRVAQEASNAALDAANAVGGRISSWSPWGR